MTPRKAARALKAEQSLVDVVMTVFGEWNLAEKAVAALPDAAAGLAEGYRLWVLDNGTPDFVTREGVTVKPERQAEKLREFMRPQDRFLRVEQNMGYPGGMNYLAARGAAPLIFILTADVVLQPGALGILVREMDDATVGVAAPLLTFPQDGTGAGPGGKVQSAGIAFDVRGRPHHIFIGWSPDNPRVAAKRDMAAVTGACFLTRRSLWRDIGGFAADAYGAGTYEDVEYCLEVRRRGRIVLFVPAARGVHYVAGSVRHGANAGGFPLSINEAVFRGRNARMLAWDQWRYY